MAQDLGSPSPRSGSERIAQAVAIMGVIGSGVTLLAVLQETASLTQWMRTAIELWQFASAQFWEHLGETLSISLRPWQSHILTFASFVLTASIGVRNESRAPKLPLLGVLWRCLLLGVLSLALIFVVFSAFIGVLGYAPGREQQATVIAMAAIYLPCATLLFAMTKRNRGTSSLFTWAAIVLSSGVALLFALAVNQSASIPGDVRLLFFVFVFGVLSGFAIAAPLLLAPHKDLSKRYAMIFAIVAAGVGLSEISKLL